MKLWAALLLSTLVMNTQAGDQPSLYEIPLKTIDGKATSLKDYEGDVLLVVNVASQCGLTPQYEGLQSVFSKYQDKGLKVLGFPCNDFGAQEPGTNDEIKVFFTSKYEVSFPMFDKLHVKGNEQHPLYAALTGKESPFPGDIEWNFGKFLIDRNGKILKRFNPRTEPGSEEITNAIEAALKQ